MEAWELFNFIREIKHDEYITSGDDVQWTIKVYDSNKIFRLIFEDSCGKRDWINNFNFPIKIYKNQKSCLLAARGWGNAYKSCKDEVMKGMEIAIWLEPNYEIHICGWSYGGAMSLLAAEDLFYRFNRKAKVFTFGAPKPLYGKKSQEYVRSCVEEVHQYSHVNDCVPLMPPLPGYKRLVTDKLGKGFSFIKLFKPRIYHRIYGDESQYNERGNDETVR